MKTIKELQAARAQKREAVADIENKLNSFDEILLSRELNDDEKKVMFFVYGLDGRTVLSDKEIAARLHVSDSRVGQIKSKALQKMRNPWKVK